MTGLDPSVESAVLACLDAKDLNGAATKLVRGYGPQILGYLTAMLRSEDRAADAFSIFSEELWKSIGSFQRASSVRTWAYKLAFHAATRIMRDPQRRRGVPLGTSEAEAIVQEVRASTAAYLRTENKTQMQKLREELSEDEQSLLVLRVDRNLDWREIAFVLDVEEATARKRFERVKDRMRALAKERGIFGE